MARNSSSEPQWISVKDRLPDAWTKVVVTDGSSIAIGIRAESIGWVVSDNYYLEKHLTHWLPLPTLPE